MKKTALIFLLLLFAGEIKSADETAQQTEEYLQAGREDAELMRKYFENMDKPAYQKAFDDYQMDLEYIASYGVAPDNEALYDDLREMNSEEPFVYSRSERDNRFDYKRYSY